LAKPYRSDDRIVFPSAFPAEILLRSIAQMITRRLSQFSTTNVTDLAACLPIFGTPSAAAEQLLSLVRGCLSKASEKPLGRAGKRLAVQRKAPVRRNREDAVSCVECECDHVPPAQFCEGVMRW
jgi:hypothetical protein